MFLRFPSIPSFRQFLQLQLPEASRHLELRGTVKLHGANAGIVSRPEGTLFAQSRNRSVTADDEHMGFASHLQREIGEEALLCWLREAVPQSATETVAVYGEWCGAAGLPRRVAVAQLPPTLVIFAVALGESTRTWLDIAELPGLSWPERRIYRSTDFETFSLRLDRDDPEASLAELQQLADRVEAECPVAKALGQTGRGEGVVWQWSPQLSPEFGFKVKGQEFSGTRFQRRLATKATRVHSAQEFLDHNLGEDRLLQAIEMLLEGGQPLTKKSRRSFVNIVSQELVDEESDTLFASGISLNDIRPPLAARARQWYAKYLRECS